MGSSRRFASAAADLCCCQQKRPIQTRFPCGFGPEGLNHSRRRQLAGSLCKRHAVTQGRKAHRAPTACRRMVSGSVSSPNRGSSHLSVALLSSLSVVREYLALRDGPRRFSRDSTWPDLLRYPSGGRSAFAYGTVTLCGLPFQTVLLAVGLVTPM